jgi:hypothetical protein
MGQLLVQTSETAVRASVICRLQKGNSAHAERENAGRIKKLAARNPE